MDQGVWHDEDFKVRIKLENPKLGLTNATQMVRDSVNVFVLY
jgi:hypothetical protein